MAEPAAPRRINLALQGGGSHGAFTWGVLDALLEDGQLEIDGLSGTSAGAVNAVALAHGFAQAASQGLDAAAARELARATLARVWEGVGALGSLMGGAAAQPGAAALRGLMAHWLSPYDTNPLGINPLRSLIEREIDFELLARGTAPQVFVCATNVRTGRGEIFSGRRLSVDAVMASACLPLLFKAVEIDGERYWDGGYSGNPALHPLLYQTETADILLVQINPIEHHDLPDSAQEILERVNEVTFNASLLAELRAIEFVRRLLAEGKLDPRRYKNVRLHRVDGGAALAAFGAASKMRSDLAFVKQLFALGREAGQQWLATKLEHVGQRASVDIAKDY